MKGLTTALLVSAGVLTQACSPALDVAPSPVVVAPIGVPSSITLSAMSGVGNAIGTVYLTAQIRDASGRGVGATVVRYTTTAGTLQPATVTADGGGLAQNLVTTTAPATITATAGSVTVAIDVVPTAPPPVFVPPPPVFPPVVPSPTPAPTPAPPGLVASMTCTPTSHAAACNLAVTYGGAPVQSTNVSKVDWDWGDGISAIVLNSPVASHAYAQAGSYHVGAMVTALTPDGLKMAFTSQDLKVP